MLDLAEGAVDAVRGRRPESRAMYRESSTSGTRRRRPSANHSRAVRTISAGPIAASTSSAARKRWGAVAYVGLAGSSGQPSMSQKPRHWSLENEVTPSQPAAVG